MKLGSRALGSVDQMQLMSRKLHCKRKGVESGGGVVIRGVDLVPTRCRPLWQSALVTPTFCLSKGPAWPHWWLLFPKIAYRCKFLNLPLFLPKWDSRACSHKHSMSPNHSVYHAESARSLREAWDPREARGPRERCVCSSAVEFHY